LAQNGDILGYIVRYRLFGYHDSPWSYRNVTTRQSSYLVTELITWKDYEVEIAAYNSKGVGSYSVPIKVSLIIAQVSVIRVTSLFEGDQEKWKFSH